MTDREKLIELLRGTEINRINGHVALAEICFTPNVFEKFADHLIANGVEIFNAEDEKVLKMARQRATEAHGDLRYLQGVQFGVESATKRWRWIPVTERLPESLGLVVALTTGGDRIIAQHDRHGWLRYGGYECERLRPITHWMPLPEPPKD